MDLFQWDVIVARQGMDTPAMHAVAERARLTCHRIFVNGDGPINNKRINLPQRAAPPQLIDGPEDSRSGTPAIIVAIRLTPLFGWLSASLGHEPTLESGRMRFQPADKVNHALHQDTYFRDGKFFTIWIPAVENGVRCNGDAPGLEFLRRRIDQELEPDRENPCQSDVSALADLLAPDDVDTHLVRPQLALGDALLFRESIPHGGYIPPHATEAKTSFDYRFTVD